MYCMYGMYCIHCVYVCTVCTILVHTYYVCMDKDCISGNKVWTGMHLEGTTQLTVGPVVNKPLQTFDTTISCS